MFNLVVGVLVGLALGYVIGYKRGYPSGRRQGRADIMQAEYELIHGNGGKEPTSILTSQSGHTISVPSDEPEIYPMSEIPENGRKVVIFRSDAVMNLPIFKGVAIRTVNDIVIKDTRGVRLWSTLKAHDGANGWKYL